MDPSFSMTLHEEANDIEFRLGRKELERDTSKTWTIKKQHPWEDV